MNPTEDQRTKSERANKIIFRVHEIVLEFHLGINHSWRGQMDRFNALLHQYSSSDLILKTYNIREDETWITLIGDRVAGTTT